MLFVAACSSESTTTTVPVVSSPAVQPALADTVQIDYSHAVENLPGSPYYYQVHVYNVAFKTVKKAFQQQKDAYSAPSFVDGKQLTFSFDMTNPYDKSMQAPIPDYFRLQSACFDLGEGAGAANTSYNRFSRVYELSGSQLTTSTGQDLHDVAGAQRATTSTYQLPFKPHQTRTFKVTLEKPFAADCPSVTLLGFTKSDQNAGEQVYVGMILDVATGTIIDQQTRLRKEAFVSTE